MAFLRKLTVLLCALALLLCFATGVSAANSITSAQTAATVSSDGSCQVNMTLTIHLEEAVSKLSFPVPENATGVSLNGSRVTAPRSGGARQVDLSRLLRKLTGDLSFSIQYSLRDTVQTTEEGILELQLPLLCGFQYPIENLSFTVTMPGNVDVKPAFSSGYHKSSIEADLSCQVDGMTVTGTALKPMKDHETLVMTMPVSADMFPRTVVQVRDTGATNLAMGICAALALLYWLIFLRYFPMWRQASTEPPEGYDAGSLGSILALQGMDLSMMVLTWAQLGYLTITRQKRDQVLLRKRMDMGNERSRAEQTCFHKLFAKGDTVDTGSLAFARLWVDMGQKCAPMGELLHKRSGNVRIFRGLAALMGLFGGAGIGLVMAGGAVLQWFMMVLMAALGGLCGWVIIGWGASLGLRNKTPLYTGLGLSALWLLLGLSCGEFLFALWMVVGLLTAGLLLRFSGLRTQLGRQTAARIAGLRHHLKTQDPKAMAKRLETDPDYFFRVMPYAMALNADKAFSKAFRRLPQGDCPYISGGPGEGLTAATWRRKLHELVGIMEARARQLPLERFLRFLRNIRR